MYVTGSKTGGVGHFETEDMDLEGQDSVFVLLDFSLGLALF